MVVWATVIKIARAIIILKPAFLVVPSPGRWSMRQEVAVGWWKAEGRMARVGGEHRGTGRRRWKRMAVAVTVTEAWWPRRARGLVSCTLGIEVRDERPVAVGEVEKGQQGWVIYFPPARHNLSRGFSREHAESAAIEEEAGQVGVCGEKRT